MGRSGPETRLVNRIRQAIHEGYPGAYVAKIHGGPYQVAGFPDLLVIIEGRAYAIEVKCQQPGESREAALGRVTPIQRACLASLARAGAIVGVALNVEDALEILSSGA